MEKLLLHICCGPDLTYSYEYFSQKYDVTGFYYNPNIDTLEEYELRYKQVEIVSKHYGFNVIKCEYNPEEFLETVKGYENEPEMGSRCMICHRINLEKTIQYAKEHNYMNVSTTLTISPHKLVKRINEIAVEITEQYGINFIEEVLRKNNGFLRSIEISKELNLYRQNYCGCVFSRRNSE